MALVRNLLLISLLLYFVSTTTTGQAKAQTRKLGTTVSSLGHKATVLFEDSRSGFWFAGGNSGVFRYDGMHLVRYSKEDGLCSHDVLAIEEDRHGNIYFDTTEGVSRFDGKQFSTLKDIVIHDSPESGWRLNANDLWFRMGWSEDGPYRYDGQQLHKLRFPEIVRAKEFRERFPNATWSPYGVYSRYQDRSGVLWFGTAALGVCRYDGKSFGWIFEKHLTETPAGGSQGIRATLEDKDGFFWFSNTRFRYEIAPATKSENGNFELIYARRTGVENSQLKTLARIPYFMSAVEDNAGNMWLATYDEGVWRTDGEKLDHFPIRLKGKKVLCFSVYKDSQGTVWLGTHNGGAFKFNGRSFEPFEIP